MRILTALTYYRPYVSGLTVYVERLARAWARAGHEVTVLTAQYSNRLPREESLEGVRVVRVPVAFRLSKGVIMPGFGREATRQVRSHEVVSLHLPQFDAAGLALRARRQGKPVVLTYHCDLRLPAGLLSWPAMLAIRTANRIAAANADAVVTYTEDYGRNTPFLARQRAKLRVIRPPVEVASADSAPAIAFKQKFAGGGPTIGMAARLAAEKGVEVLLAAMPRILREHPGARVLFAGQHQNVIGEAEYARRLAPRIADLGEHWQFLGILDPAAMSGFFSACDVTVLPSLNSTESFGLVQIESMICGTPVVASDLPGVRQPVRETGLGRVVPLHDPEALAQAVLDLLREPPQARIGSDELRSRYSPDSVAAAYIQLFQSIAGRAA